jgi:NAD(P)-dependent dehydrogenase (short-subunit alcohol dehydrogenase family)
MERTGMILQASESKGTALVTGASRRIGAAIARALVGAGYSLILHSSERSRAATEKLAEGLRPVMPGTGETVAIVTGDLMDRGTPATLLAQAASVAGSPLTLLVNNASIFEPDGLDTIDAERWDRHFDINLRAPVFLSAAFAEVCQRPGSCIVNIADQRVWRLNPQYFTYTLTKSALWTATQTMAQALAPDIRVNAVGPGPVLPNVNEGDSGFAREVENIPLEQAVSPDEIARAVVYLAGSKSITGQLICVDGGQHLAWKTPDVAQ